MKTCGYSSRWLARVAWIRYVLVRLALLVEDRDDVHRGAHHERREDELVGRGPLFDSPSSARTSWPEPVGARKRIPPSQTASIVFLKLTASS